MYLQVIWESCVELNSNVTRDASGHLFEWKQAVLVATSLQRKWIFSQISRPNLPPTITNQCMCKGFRSLEASA